MTTFRSSLASARLLAIVLVGLFVGPAAALAGTGYTAQGGKLYDPVGQRVQVRGISHFGFNAEILQPQYLWSMGWKEQIAQIKSLGFNAVRVPFVPETLYSDQPVDVLSYVDPNKNADLLGRTPLEVLDMWMAEANRQGLYIMLDFHSVTKMRLYPTWFIDDPADYGLSYDGQAYSEDDWVRDLKFVAQRYAHLPHFFAVDIYNEPNGVVRWSTGDPNVTDPKYFWKRAAEKAAAGVLQSNPDLLIFVQGINGNYDGIEDSDIPMNWGESFQQQAYQPLDIPFDKLVLSPHTYGPDVYHKPTFDDPGYPDNLAQDWETLFGRFSPTHPVIIGEWGGRYGEGGVGEADVIWQDALVDYLLSKGINGSFYWTYTPNSGDTGGILDDSLNVREDKMALLRRHWGDGSTSPTPGPEPEPTPTPDPETFTAAFSLSPNVNDWWVEVYVEASASVGSVHARVNDGSWTSLPATGWASWARSFHVPEGSKVVFRATATDGSTATSGTYLWLQSEPEPGPEPEPEPTPEPEPEPEPGTLAASFDLSPNVNAWWVEVRVDASRTLAFVHTRINGGAWVSLPQTDWGSWARSLSVPEGSEVVFRATASDGSTVASGTYLWLQSEPPADEPSQEIVAPYIQDFSPRSGRVGSVVTFTGSGFTGLDNAWVGDSRQATVRVISDSQAEVVVPPDATTGSIGLFNSAGVSFTARSFTVKKK